jgi:opacity protein-like surface antigen
MLPPLSRTSIAFWGTAMKKVVLAAVFAAASIQGAFAADGQCYSAADIEAEQAILFQTNLMVISSACRDTVYGEFRARNKDAIIRYQKAIIDHYKRGGSLNAQSDFERGNTSLANEITLKNNGAVCQQGA